MLTEGLVIDRKLLRGTAQSPGISTMTEMDRQLHNRTWSTQHLQHPEQRPAQGMEPSLCPKSGKAQKKPASEAFPDLPSLPFQSYPHLMCRYLYSQA